MSKRNNKNSSETLPMNQQTTMQLAQAMYHSGPLPPPESLAKYEKVHQGAAERIFQMAEQQAAHRQELEKITVKSQARNSFLGLISGTVIGLTGILSSTYVALSGYSVEGISGVVASLAALAGVFVYGKHSNQKEMIEKQKLINKISDDEPS